MRRPTSAQSTSTSSVPSSVDNAICKGPGAWPRSLRRKIAIISRMRPPSDIDLMTAMSPPVAEGRQVVGARGGCRGALLPLTEKPMIDAKDIEDDLPLLDLMLADTKAAPAEYRPTNYWSNNLDPIVWEFRNEGLKGFRSRACTRLGTFGGSDLRPRWRYLSPWAYENALTVRAPAMRGAARSLERWVNHWLIERKLKLRAPYGLSGVDLLEAAFHAANREATFLNKKPLSDIAVSTAGAPEDVLVHDSKAYTWNFIGHYLRYLFASQWIDFQHERVVVELGPGAGTSVELLKKLHPHLSFILFDIPPALYLGHQYLRAVFGDEVVPYRETRESARLGRPDPGRIYVFGSWQFPALQTLRDYVFWNAASMQEMEPSVVANYLSYVDRGASGIYLLELMGGQVRASEPGKHGVLEPTLFRHYEAALPSFRLVARGRARTPIGFLADYEETVWHGK
jgi:putative sugar O-methyltransferase